MTYFKKIIMEDRSYQLSWLIMLILGCLFSVSRIHTHELSAQGLPVLNYFLVDVWDNSLEQSFLILFPMIAIIPSVHIFSNEVHRKHYAMTRIPMRKYIRQMCISAFLSSFVLALFFLLSCFLFTYMIVYFPTQDYYSPLMMFSVNNTSLMKMMILSPSLFLMHPSLYLLAYLIFISLFSGVLGILSALGCYLMETKYLSYLFPYIIYLFVDLLGIPLRSLGIPMIQSIFSPFEIVLKYSSLMLGLYPLLFVFIIGVLLYILVTQIC